MLDQNDTTYFDLSGALVYDPCIGDCGNVQMYIPTNQFAVNNQVILNLNESTLNESMYTNEQQGNSNHVVARWSLTLTE
jgi:carboxypeptidase D